jgi:tRNA nucleotidyltransferase (CCA-adding enzyme)
MPLVPAGPEEHHPEGDLLTHSMQVMGRVAERTGEPLARFCALFHDIGKLATDPALYPKHHGHDEAGFDLGRPFCDRLRLPATYRNSLAWTSRLHGTLNRWPELRGSTRVRTAEQALKAGIAGILPLVATADKPNGLKTDEWKMAVRVAVMTTAELGVDMERIEAMPEDKRPAFILQRRVEVLRGLLV